MKAIFTLWCVIAIGLQLKAEESKKIYEKKFPKEDLEELVLSNNYGKIEIVQTEGEEIEAWVEMKVVAKSGVKAEETLELIEVLETRTGRHLNLETRFGKDMAIKQFLTGISVSVFYKIHLPKGVKLRLISSNGNVYLGNYEGELNADIKDGDFKAVILKGGEVYVKQERGNFTVEGVKNLNGDFKNCVLEVESGDDVRLVTNGCEGHLESIDRLNIRSNGGTMKIGDVEEINGSSSFTKYEVLDLGNILDLDMKMGEINVRNIQLLFSEVRIKGSFTKVGLTFSPDAGYHLELKRNKSLKVDLPHNMRLEERPTTERNMTVGTKFTGNPKYSGKVFLELSNGNLFIQ